MSFPSGLDPAIIENVYLNAYYFKDEDDQEIAEAETIKLFPHAAISWYLFHEDLSSGVLSIRPVALETNEDLSRYRSLIDFVEDQLPQGPHRGDPRYCEGNYEDGKYVGPDLKSSSSETDP